MVKKGDTVFLRGDRYSKGLQKLKVIKVGRKYFYTEGIKFRLEDNVEEKDRGSPRRCYFSEQTIWDENEQNRLCELIHKAVDRWRLPKVSLEDLRAIAKILKLD